MEAENSLWSMACPADPDLLGVARGAAKAAVDERLGAASTYHLGSVLPKAGPEALAQGALTESQAAFLSTRDQVALLRRSTPAAEQDALAAKAAERQAQLEAWADLGATFDSVVVVGKNAAGNAAPVWTLQPLSGAPDEASLVAFAKLAGAAADARRACAAWSHDEAGWHPHPTVEGPGGAAAYHHGDWTTSFRAWAKDQPLGHLRHAAEAMGLAHAKSASRAQVQNYVAAAWDTAEHAGTIQEAVAKKAGVACPGPLEQKPLGAKGVDVAALPASYPTAEPAPKAPKATATASAAKAPPPVATTSASRVTTFATPPPAGASFAAKHLALVAALKHHAASRADLPARLPAAEVAAWAFGPVSAAPVGGGHAKSFHAAPDGRKWLFKPDRRAGGATAQAEAAASAAFSAVGVPAVPVYARRIGAHVGSVQPWVEGTTTLAGSGPTSWSQADVDAVVRYHVAAWAVGDHDGHPGNVLRTAGGGLVPVDQGQAFKFFGRDRLAADYHPNAAWGSPRPVYHQAYEAAQAGGLAPGVKVRPEAALPVIKAFEAMPDAQWRALLFGVAREGAEGGRAHWVEPMRTAARKATGKAEVSDADVAEAFLAHACERKGKLRRSFAEFFSGLGFADGAAKLKRVS